MKLSGGIAPYMMGLVVGVAVVSTVTANQARLANEKTENEYIQSKKEYAEKLVKSLESKIYEEQTTSSSSFSNSDLQKYVYTNIFDSNDSSSQLRTGSNTDGEKLMSVSLDANPNKRNELNNPANVRENITDIKTASIADEQKIRKKQISQSYQSMKDEARELYTSMLSQAEAKWPCSIVSSKKDVWGRDFTFARTDDYNATLSFNYPWDNTKNVSLKLQLPELPAEVDGFKEMKLGGFTNSYAITNNGNLWVAGRNDTSQLGIDNGGSKIELWQKTPLTDVKEVAPLSSRGAIVLTNGGEVWGAGLNSQGELGLGHNNEVTEWTKLPISNIADIYAVEGQAAFAIDNSGQLYATGDNQYGTIGNGTTTDTNTWALVAGAPANIVYMYSYRNEQIAALTASGELWLIGRNFSGALGFGHSAVVSTWTKVTAVPEPVKHVGMLVNKTVYAIGSDDRLYVGGTQFYYGNQTHDKEWQDVGMPDVKFISSNTDDALFVINNSNELWTIGNNLDAVLGTGDRTAKLTWSKDPTFPQGVKSILTVDDYYSYGASYVVTTDNKLYVTGTNQYGQLGVGNTTMVQAWTEVVLPSPVKEILYGANSPLTIYAILQNGKLYVAGANTGFAVGDGSSSSSHALVFTETSLSNIKKVVAANSGISFAIDTDDNVYATGGNYGQHGKGSLSNRYWHETIGPNSTVFGTPPTACP